MLLQYVIGVCGGCGGCGFVCSGCIGGVGVGHGGVDMVLLDVRLLW